MDYGEALRILRGLPSTEIKPGLDRIRRLVECLDHPERAVPCVHVGGTNGKGSVVAMLDAVLRAAGYCVGRFTSPELEDPRERIVVHGEWIAEPELAAMASLMIPLIEQADDRPSAFEVWTAIAFEHFRRKAVDLSLIEVGLGGRFDATSVVRPVVSVITNVTLDHVGLLGDTVGQIAWEKAGIAKAGVPMVVGQLHPEARAVITSECASRGAPLLEGLDIEPIEESRSFDATVFRLDRSGLPKRITLSLGGGVQRDNLAVALRVIECLRGAGIDISNEALTVGLASVTWPGRWEVARRDPMVILDGAHNVAGAEALARDVETFVPERSRRRLLLGILEDKDAAGIVAALASTFPAICLCRSTSPRAAHPWRLRSLIDEHSVAVTVYDSVPDALRETCQGLDEADVLVVAGSLTVVGEARRWLREGYGNAG